MPKIKSKTIIKNGTRYYTARYFAEKTFMSVRNARNVLSKYECIKGYSNPRLYTKQVMDVAIASYNADKSLEVIEEKLEEKRAAEELQYRECLQYPIFDEQNKLENDIGYQVESEAIYSVRKDYNERLLIMMMKHLFYLRGYEFDEELFQNDLEFNAVAEAFREEGEMRSKEHRKIIKRLESNNAYLIKI